MMIDSRTILTYPSSTGAQDEKNIGSVLVGGRTPKEFPFRYGCLAWPRGGKGSGALNHRFVGKYGKIIEICLAKKYDIYM